VAEGIRGRRAGRKCSGPWAASWAMGFFFAKPLAADAWATLLRGPMGWESGDDTFVLPGADERRWPTRARQGRAKTGPRTAGEHKGAGAAASSAAQAAPPGSRLTQRKRGREKTESRTAALDQLITAKDHASGRIVAARSSSTRRASAATSRPSGPRASTSAEATMTPSAPASPAFEHGRAYSHQIPQRRARVSRPGPRPTRR